MINSGLLKELIKNQDINILEKHLIFNYLRSQNLNFKKSPILSFYFDDFELQERLILDIENLNIENLKALEKYLELLIPKNDRKINGAFFTPDYIVDFIINEIKPKPNHKNLDPSCGCGAFLTGLVNYYHTTFGKSIKNIIKENIFGSDILSYNVDRK